jgi:hypothetical protein
MPSMPSSVRTVGGTGSPPTATSNLSPPQPVVPPPLTQRDTLQPNGALTAPQPPSLPPAPPTLPATGPASSSTSKYTPPPTTQQLPPETIPGQSKIPTLPPGPTPVD